MGAGYFGIRRYQKWRADKKQTEYITKVGPFQPLFQPPSPKMQP